MHSSIFHKVKFLDQNGDKIKFIVFASHIENVSYLKLALFLFLCQIIIKGDFEAKSDPFS